MMTVDDGNSPFHEGEKALQARLGIRDQTEATGRRLIRDYLPEQHRDFYTQLPFLFIGANDTAGRPWASILLGRPGFVSSPDPRTLKIDGPFIDGDPLAMQLEIGAPLGVLGIDFSNRRRNRLSATVTATNDDALLLGVVQSFGNCPQYIQARAYTLLDGIDTVGEPRDRDDFDKIDGEVRRVIDCADNFLIATHYAAVANPGSGGADVSHRGGMPGFVHTIDDRILEFPDFPGNRHFNTLGNILCNPRAGLTFVDFAGGDVVILTGRAEIIWDGPGVKAVPGAERLIRFHLERGRRIRAAVPIRWTAPEFSPRFRQMGYPA